MTFVFKMLKRIVASQLASDEHAGFDLGSLLNTIRPIDRAQERALLRIFSYIIDATKSAQETLLGMLDLNAVFDTVDNDILNASKVVRCRGGTTLEWISWISSFILGRSQSVIFNGLAIHTDSAEIQGQMLLPLLFITYTPQM